MNLGIKFYPILIESDYGVKDSLRLNK